MSLAWLVALTYRFGPSSELSVFSVIYLHVVWPVVGLQSEETRNEMYLAKHVLSVILRSVGSGKTWQFFGKQFRKK